MKVIDQRGRTSYEVKFDYVDNDAQIKWQSDKSFVIVDQKDVLEDILKRPQDIRNSNIFERRFLIKKSFDK